MNILLMGCSWSVPNYYGPPGDPAETHTEFLLKSMGHNVINCGLNNGSNLQTLKRATDLLLDGKSITHPTNDIIFEPIYPSDNKIDLVIWFHTDPGRDVDVINCENKTVEQQLQEICNYTYSRYSDFFYHLNCKIAIIGACADVYSNLTNYINPNFLLTSWQKELLGVSTGFFRLESKLYPPSDKDFQLLENVGRVYDKMYNNRNIFPDGCHPGKIAHKDLVNKLKLENIISL